MPHLHRDIMLLLCGGAYSDREVNEFLVGLEADDGRAFIQNVRLMRRIASGVQVSSRPIRPTGSKSSRRLPSEPKTDRQLGESVRRLRNSGMPASVAIRLIAAEVGYPGPAPVKKGLDAFIGKLTNEIGEQRTMAAIDLIARRAATESPLTWRIR